jgi:hypothetical protein
MNLEQRNILQSMPDALPDGEHGRTIVIHAENGDSQGLLERVRLVWSVLASCGFYDNAPYQELSDEDKYKQLNSIFSREETDRLPDDFEVFDRDWYWWSSAIIDQFIKIDLIELARPNSFGTIRETIRACGGEILAESDWIDSKSIRAVVEEIKQRERDDGVDEA